MRRAILIALAAGAPLAAGCGSSAKGPAGQFASLGCASCHTLKAAGSHGDVGPDLDKLKPSVAAVEQQVTNGGGAMPSFKDKLTRAQIHALAVYVARAAGRP
ncbi:MAG: sulfide dehydrogenase [Solirubrobacteraceae bacterium]|nr:sulfide dehydrogenase [Solirubrobacteraceae bacterium]